MTATEATEVLHGALVRMPSPGGRLSVAELKQEAEEVRELVRAVLIENSDYGQIPGTKKPTLFKSGAETLLRRFGFGHRMDKVEIDRDDEGRHYGVTYRCTVHVIADPDMVVSTCDGYCGYDEPDREEHQSQWGKTIPRAPWNTMIKMAQKRALIGATLQATATSGLFTQDMEDAGTTAAATDQRDWYEQNGWTGADEESTCHSEIIAKAKELPEVAQRAFGAWYRAEGISLKQTLTRAEYDALAAKLEAIANGEAPADEPASAGDGSATKPEPQPERETADQSADSQPEAEGSTAAAVPDLLGNLESSLERAKEAQRAKHAKDQDDLADKMDAALNADPDRMDPVEKFKQETGLTDEYMAESNAKFEVTPAYTADVIAAVMDMDRETRVAMLAERKLPTSGNLDSLGKRLAEALVGERWQPEAGTLL